MPRQTRTLIESPAGGAALGAAAVLLTALATIWITSYVPAFAANRGLLQLLVAVPIAEAITGFALTYLGVLPLRQTAWAVVPVEALILIGSGVWDIGPEGWPWVLVLSACALVPWLLGTVAGSAARRRTSTD